MNNEALRLEIKDILEKSEKLKTKFEETEILDDLRDLVLAAQVVTEKVIDCQKNSIALTFNQLKMQDVYRAYNKLMGKRELNLSYAIGDLITMLIEMDAGRQPVKEIFVLDSKSIVIEESADELFNRKDSDFLIKVINPKEILNYNQNVTLEKKCDCGESISLTRIGKKEPIDLDALAACDTFKCEKCGKFYTLCFEEHEEEEF